MVRCPLLLWLLLLPAGLRAAPGELALGDLSEGTQWLGWNADGEYVLPLPADWRYAPEAARPVTVHLPDNATATLASGRLSLPDPTRVVCRAAGVRGTLHRGVWELEFLTRRLEFPAEVPCEAGLEAFGPSRRGTIAALSWPEPETLTVTVSERTGLDFDRVQWLAARPARVFQADLPHVDQLTEVSSGGLWSPARLRFTLHGASFRLVAKPLGWAELDGRSIRPAGLILDAPEAEVRLRRETVRATARRAIECVVSEPLGLLAEGTSLRVTGAPGVVGLAAADAPGSLAEFLQRHGAARSGGGEDPLMNAVADYLAPLWYGLWYDARTGREEVRQPPSLTVFTRDWTAAVTAAGPALAEWLTDRLARYADCRLDRPEPMAGALGEIVRDLSAGDRAREIFYSVYLSDLLGELAGGSVFYWQPRGTLLCGDKVAPVDLDDVAARAASGEPTPLTVALTEAVAAAGLVDEVTLPRLDPGGRVPVRLLLLAGRTTPIGTYRATVTLGDGGPGVPLQVQVQPSLGEIFLVALAGCLGVLAALALVSLGLRWSARRGGKESGGEA